MNPSVVQRPPWYQGDHLPRSRPIEIKRFGELSGQVLDEIIQEKVNNPAFLWTDISIFLGLNRATLKCILKTWIRHKKLLAKIPPETAATDQALRDILGQGSQVARNWQRYRFFIDNGGCPAAVDEAMLFGNFKFRTPYQIISQLSSGQELVGAPLPLPVEPPTTTKA